MNETSREVLNVKQVAVKTGISRATIYRLEKAGEFPERRLLSARRVGWLVSEVEAWIESRTRAGDDARTD